MAEESHVLPATTSGRNIDGLYQNPVRDVSSPLSAPVYYPTTVSDAGILGLGFGNAAPAVTDRFPRMPGAGMGAAGVNSTTGFSYNPNLGNRVSGGGSDQASDEGGDDSVSGKKVKFLCSFGGKILPRPSDGALRYVGGQTRIISFRRDVNFNELVQKIVDTYGQNVVIKYQLPDEDLDALVSVSCPDDLENMMDEYEKLVARSSDGSAKLRVFLFSASELDSSGVMQVGDLQDSGQRYVEAVNGVLDGVVGGGITRKDSITSAASTQNSGYSGTEGVDSSVHGPEDVTGLLSTGKLSPRANITITHETAPKIVYVEVSGSPLGITPVGSAPPPILPVPQQQMRVDLQQPVVTFPQTAPYLQTYTDPHQETINRADYVQVPSQMGFPAQLMGTAGLPMFAQPQFRDSAVGVSPHQYIPAVHMTMTPSSHVNITPNMVPPQVQPHQVCFEHYPEVQRVVQLPGDQSYNAYQAQVPPTTGWVPQQQQMALSEGWVPQPQVIFPDKITRLEDCVMCQKALPHAHSDTVTQGIKEIPTTAISDLNSVYHSLQMQGNIRGRSTNMGAVTGALLDGIVGQEGAEVRPSIYHNTEKSQLEGVVVSQNLDRLYKNDRTLLQKADNPDHHQVPAPQGGVLPPYNVLMGTDQENAVQQVLLPTQYQVKQEDLMNKPVYSDTSPVGVMPPQTSDHFVLDSSKLSGINRKEDSFEPLRQADGRMENLQIHRPEVFLNNEPSKSQVDNPTKEDILGNESQNPNLDIFFRKPTMTNQARQIEMLPCTSNEVPYTHDFRPLDSYEVAQLPHLGGPPYPPSKPAVNQLTPDEVSHGNSSFSHVTERILPIGEWKDNSLGVHPMMVPSDVEAVPSNANFASSLFPSNGVGDIQDSSNSLFSNQDPWNLQHDNHLPPPRPNKILMKKDGTTNPFENRFGNIGEPLAGNIEDGVYQPSGNFDVDFGVEQGRSSKGSAEEKIKQELQAVAEGVAANVLQSSMPSNPDIDVNLRSGLSFEASQNSSVHDSNVEMQMGERYEEVTKLPGKMNIGFPVSDGLGRLQIIKNNDLEELRELGSGTFGTVFHGKWRGSDVAIKRINDRCFAGKPSEQDRMREDFWNEAIKLADLHHPNVVAFYGVVIDGPGDTVATVTEYMVNGSLRNALQKNERSLDKRKRLIIAMDVAFGMEYLHGKNIVHFDLKSDNLLVNLRDPHRPICKVGDLGLSKVKCQTLISGGVRGTLPWMAPELLNGSSSLVSEKVDVFSFGIVMWELLTGDEPYADLHYGAIIGGIVSNTLRPPVPESCDPEWRSLMERCWSAEPLERPSFTNVANQLRIMAAKVPQKAQNQQQPQPQARS
ncbi:hypothetical protein LguiA_011165 [Lonicera macranthoides]